MADINKSFQLKVLADVTAYQAEMAKIPGVTEKQAAAAALRMEREMVKAAKATGTAAQAAASGGADALGKSFGQAKEQVALVAAGASRISPELGAVVNTASAALGVLKSMVSPVGALTAAVTVAGAAFVKLTGDIERAETKANEQAKIAIKAQLGIIDSGYYVNNALEAQDRISLAKRKGVWVGFARDYAQIFSLGGLNPIANAVLDQLSAYEKGIQADIDAAMAWQKESIRLAQAQQEVEKTTKKTTKAVKEHTEAVVENADTEIEYAQNVADIKVDALEQTAAATDAVAESSIAEAEAVRESGQTKIDTGQAVFDATQALAVAGTTAAAAMFGDMKEIAIAEAVINTAAAVVSALKNPPGPPFSIAQAVAAGAMGAAQIAKIASTNVAHSGLAFDPSAGSRQAMAPDETPWKLRKNEGVLTARGVQAAGGYQQVRRLNAGQSPSMGSSFVGITQFKHKMLDATIGPNIARPAAARTEIKAIAASGGRVGHRLRSNS